jgi:hypothetical protein
MGNGAAGCTAHLTDATFSATVPPVLCPNGSVIPGGALTATIETAVFHITVNTAGDSWATSTEQGNFALAGNNGVAYTGHLESWFGASVNMNNFVFDSTFNVVARGSDGSTLGFHVLMHFSTNASGMLVMVSQLTCS